MKGDFSAETRVLVAERSQGWCEARTEGCMGRATHVHHRLLRRHGDHTLDNALHCCAACHAWIHAHPAISYVNGWLTRSRTAA